ncbi:MAG: hypothetical protein U5K69_04430 [Balneolaceae bacterium]|nr:hypothetical protein [Balneolaceae bacterium]
MAFTYEQLCSDPKSVLESIQGRIKELYQADIPLSQEPPSHFELHRYNDHQEEKERFQELLNNFK